MYAEKGVSDLLTEPPVEASSGEKNLPAKTHGLFSREEPEEVRQAAGSLPDKDSLPDTALQRIERQRIA